MTFKILTELLKRRIYIRYDCQKGRRPDPEIREESGFSLCQLRLFSF